MCASKTLSGTVASICDHTFWKLVASSRIVKEVHYTIDHYFSILKF
ncbi:hypothetical protein F383_30777 [Gossypium arboreum]|uniref:Uncharacterized protein n=1 Tax=Gossypium arboreum TaxID=29729 RepID=A0A0B0PGC8_GOSAR|nr:hypothetical protein F383_30777 [Gossypium arboreum]